ncbi:hypothetical protein CVT26_009772 [Gymnopilus dilepis]|uniref:F-box domain-containing protein n=1 Tax=Gymnopilus dilepis TaxID=231916 RepID=A0A409YIR1_9AGAR|nr:hypothetical protein CVT26_009772 [Gymnopilus dilepis]
MNEPSLSLHETDDVESQDSFDLEREDLRIADLDTRIHNLRAFRANICQSRNRHIQINSLPVEVLSEMFVLGQAATQEEKAPYQPTIFPLTLGSVCRQWRYIAWSLSELWADVHCRLSKSRCDAQALLLRQWLERSQQRPLSICISSKDEEAWTGSTAVSTAIPDAIIPHSERWVQLALILPEAWYCQLDQVQGKVPNLISLSIRSPNSQPLSLSFGTFAHTASIRNLFASYFHLANIHLRWDLLETVVLQGFTTNEAIDIICRCQNMVSCRFDELGALEHTVTQIAVNASLQELSISTDEWADLDDFLDRIFLPGLSDLTLTLPEGHHHPIPIIQSLVIRSVCPLKRVGITGVEIAEEDLVEFLLDNDSVTTIRVN